MVSLCLFILAARPVFAEKADFASDIQTLETEIALIESEFSNYGEGLIQNLMASRKQVLQLTLDSLNFLKKSQNENIEIKYTIELPSPDIDRADALLQEIQNQVEVVKAAEKEAAKAGGLIQALALSRVETEKLTLSQLKLGYYQSLYGLPIQSITTGTASEKSDEQSVEGIDNDNLSDSSSEVEWADANYPNINYDHPNFEQYSQAGFYFQGKWAVRETSSEIDDSPEISAVNMANWYRSSYSDKVSLMARCAERSVALIYMVDTFLMNTNYNSNSLRVTYRIDDEPAVNTRWNETTSNQSVGLFGNKAERFLPKLYNAKQIFLRVKESNGQTHDATFDLTGMSETLDKIGATCGFSVLNLSKDDYKAVQTLLNAGGFNAGKPDGIWGNGSKAALKKFQESKGLEATGAINKATLSALGL